MTSFMPFMHLGAVARCCLAATLASGGVALAQAQTVQWSTGQVSIEYDPSTFSFWSDSTNGGYFDVSAVVNPLGQGVTLEFGYLSAYATSYTYFSSDWRNGGFDALIGFTPEAGYAITGYTITYTGAYWVESPGSVALNDDGGTLLLSAGSGGSSFSIDRYQGGPNSPRIAGYLSAAGDISYIEILDGYELVYSHDQEVLDYCETEEPFTCYYRTEPVYTEQPIYRYEMDLGEGQISLSSISVQAHVAAVPEPESLALGLAGLMMVAGWRLRGRRA